MAGKQTPLFGEHQAMGAKMVDFGGWDMPVQYTSIIEEHLATRDKAGLFDVSHMGEILVKGRGSREALNRLVTNNLAALEPGKIIYTLLPNDRGGVVDDLLIYMLGEEEFFLVVNASNTDKDYAWLVRNLEELAAAEPSLAEVAAENVSAQYGQIAIQGPAAQEILQKLSACDLDQIKFFRFQQTEVLNRPVILSRTGYTGEDGFEIYCDPEAAVSLWQGLLAAGKEKGLLPVGLGARDTLRFEAALPLYGHELSEEITPVEAGLSFFVKLDKCDYPGKEIIKDQIEKGTQRTLVGIELVERGIPREGYVIAKDGLPVGHVASGTHSPTFKKGLATAFVPPALAAADTELDVIIRDKPVKAKVVKLPFYRKKTGKN